MIPIFPSPFRTPAVYGLPAQMVVPPSSSPDGDHEWWGPTKGRVTHRCARCGAEVFVGIETERSLTRVAGLTCREASVLLVMAS